VKTWACVLVCLLALMGCDTRPVVADWHAGYADHLRATGELRVGDAPTCPDHITTSRIVGMYFLPISTGNTTVLIPQYIYAFDRHDLEDGTCVVTPRLS